MAAMFYNCTELSELDLSFLDINRVKNVDGIFHGCKENVLERNKVIFNRFNINDLIKIVSY